MKMNATKKCLYIIYYLIITSLSYVEYIDRVVQCGVCLEIWLAWPMADHIPYARYTVCTTVPIVHPGDIIELVSRMI
jgi:hypothetical protein